MGTINERVKEIRKSLGFTLEKFGSNLGVGKNAISRIETSKSNVTDQMFLSICREYNVNPTWLEKGTGSMFIERSEEDEYIDAATKLSDDPLVVSCLVEYAKLRPEERIAVRKYIDNLLHTYREKGEP